jgi:hypothetical protein
MEWGAQEGASVDGLLEYLDSNGDCGLMRLNEQPDTAGATPKEDPEAINLAVFDDELSKISTVGMKRRKYHETCVEDGAESPPGQLDKLDALPARVGRMSSQERRDRNRMHAKASRLRKKAHTDLSAEIIATDDQIIDITTKMLDLPGSSRRTSVAGSKRGGGAERSLLQELLQQRAALKSRCRALLC